MLLMAWFKVLLIVLNLNKVPYHIKTLRKRE